MTDWRRRKQLREERLARPVELEEFEVSTKFETTYNGRIVPMSVRKLHWLDRADQTIKRLDAKTQT